MQLTWLDSNSWLIEIAELRILLDPWLVGSLVFNNLDWLLEGKKTTSHPIPENIDFILLSQGLEDHAHPPTLEVLDHNLPVIASVNAAKVCKDMGYSDVRAIDHGESYVFADKLEIKAVKGSRVGLNLVENGYIIKDLTSNESIYYEPHGFHEANLEKQDPVKVIITPLTSIKILAVAHAIKGQESAVEVCRWLQPEYILPTAGGGDVEFEGVLNKFLVNEGTIDRFRDLLQQENLKTKVIETKSWQPVSI